MIKVFYLDITPPDEMIGLYLKSWQTRGETVTKVALPAFDGSSATSSVRAIFYRREHFKNLALADDDRLVLAGFQSLILLPKAVIARPNTTVLVTRLPSDLPSSFKHRCAALGSSLRFISPTKTIAATLTSWGVPADNITTVLPDFPPAHNAPPRAFTTPGFLVGVVCSLALEQGLESVIQAVQQSEVFIPDLKVFIIGDGPDKRRFTWLLGQTHLKDRVHIAANAADYQRFLHNLDICIAPAVHDEGCDPILLQALAQGLAVIATDTPSHAEFITNGKTGLLYAAGNSHTLSQHLVNLYTHRDWLEHYKQTGPELLTAAISVQEANHFLNRGRN